jgi:hypothetical protein
LARNHKPHLLDDFEAASAALTAKFAPDQHLTLSQNHLGYLLQCIPLFLWLAPGYPRSCSKGDFSTSRENFVPAIRLALSNCFQD